MDKSLERAREILGIYLEEAKNLSFIKSIILVGSLSDHTYTGNAGSDIDLIHIVSDEEDYRREKKCINELISEVEQKTNHDIPIARVVFQKRHLKHPYAYDFELSAENKDLIERPIEIFRIMDSGITVYGEELISTIEKPTRRDVEMSMQLSDKWLDSFRDTDWYREYMKMRDNPTIRIMTQIVLTTALSDYYFATDGICSSKWRILECIERELPDLSYLNLLKLCHKNRFFPDEMTQEDIETMKREYQTIFKSRRNYQSKTPMRVFGASSQKRCKHRGI